MKRKKLQNNTIQIGSCIKEHRIKLSLPKKSRSYFIDDRVRKNIMDPEWISEKSLTNIENGNNMPSLKTLKLLSIALEVDFIDLIKEIEEFILNTDEG